MFLTEEFWSRLLKKALLHLLKCTVIFCKTFSSLTCLKNSRGCCSKYSFMAFCTSSSDRKKLSLTPFSVAQRYEIHMAVKRNYMVHDLISSIPFVVKGELSNGIILLQDNTRTHVVKVVKEYL